LLLLNLNGNGFSYSKLSDSMGRNEEYLGITNLLQKVTVHLFVTQWYSTQTVTLYTSSHICYYYGFSIFKPCRPQIAGAGEGSKAGEAEPLAINVFVDFPRATAASGRRADSESIEGKKRTFNPLKQIRLLTTDL
jgi:hypothetical protein